MIGANTSPAPSNAVTVSSLPGPPTSVEARGCCIAATVGQIGADVSWAAPQDDGGSSVLHYRVVSEPEGRVSTTTATSTRFDSLLAPSYSFSVYAVNAAGIGPSATSNLVELFVPRAIAGSVSLQGISATSAVHEIRPVASVAHRDGPAYPPPPLSADLRYSFTGLRGAPYSVWITAPGFLTVQVSEWGSGFISAVGPNMGNVELRAGLVDHDNAVTILDISAVVASFGESVIDRADGLGRIVDLNADGVVSVRDISAVASNFGLTSPLPWPD